MAAFTSKYFVLNPQGDNLNFLDFGLSYGAGSISTAGETIQYNGSTLVDDVVLGAGTTLDLSNTGSGKDKLYLLGNLADYSLQADSSSRSLTLTRTLNGRTETAIVSAGSSSNYDFLIFANGTLSSNALYTAVVGNSALPTPDSSETSLQPAARPPANATIKAYALNPAGETFASSPPGVKFIINGGAGVDKVYVADGATVDASNTGSGHDLVYLRGNWADYQKSASAGLLSFSRSVGGATESVLVQAGNSNTYDIVVFADGAARTNDANAAIQANASAPASAIGGAGFNTQQTTPLYSDAQVAAALARIAAAAQADSASLSTPPLLDYQIAGVTGVSADNLAAINSALDSQPIDAAHADTAPKLQAIVNAYNAILASADGTGGNTATPLTGDQYAAVGVAGVSGSNAPAAGSVLYLLDDAVDRSVHAAVDSTAELQALLGAAKAVQAQASGSSGLTMDQLGLLGVTAQDGSALTTLAAGSAQQVLAAISAAADDGADTDTVAKLQSLVNGLVFQHAPVIDNPVANPSGLFSAPGAASPALAGPAVESSAGNTPTGWRVETLTGFDNASNGQFPNYGLFGGYQLGDLNGSSLNGGFYAEMYNYSKITTWMENLVVGKSYSFGLQWQQVSLSRGDGDLFAGGALTIQALDGTHDYALQTFYSSGLADGWNTAVYSFVASAQTVKIRVGVDTLPDTPYGQAAIVVDSLSSSQITASLPVGASPGVAVGQVFGSVSDADAHASVKGWAITSAAADGNGNHWQYSSDGGTVWRNLDSASLGQAVYLLPSDLLRWSGSQDAGYTRLEAKAVDDTGPAVHAPGSAAGVVDASLAGGSTAYSANTAVLAPLSILGYQDDVGPATGVLGSGSSTNDKAPLLQGSVDPALASGRHVEVFRDGIDLGAATLNGSSWSYQDAALGEGAHSYTATLLGGASLAQGAASNTLSLTVDSIAPTQKPSILSFRDDVAPLTGSFASGSATNDATPLLNGSLAAALAAGEQLRIYRDGTLRGTASVTGTQWSFQDSGVAPGSHSYTAQVVDAAQNLGPLSDSLVLVEDRTPPTIALGRSVDHLLAGQSTTIQFTLSEASTDFSLAAVQVSGASLSNFSGTGTQYSATLTASSDAAHVQVGSGAFSDAAGNRNADGADADNALDFGTNHAPVQSGPLLVTTSAALPVALLANSSDADGDALSLSNLSYSVNGGSSSPTPPPGLSLNGSVLQLDSTAFAGLAAGEQTHIQLSYTVSDGRGGSSNQSATLNLQGVNHAPVLVSGMANDAASGLFASATALGGPAIDGAAYSTPAGWHGDYQRTSPYSYGTWNITPGYFDTVANNTSDGYYYLSGMNGSSLSGRLYGVLMGTSVEYIWLENLTAGQTYTYGIQWQQVQHETGDGFYMAGGSLAIQASDALTDYAPQVYTSSGLGDSWNTALFSFVATGHTMQLSFSGNSDALAGSYGTDLVIDSLTSAQVAAAAGGLQGSGASTRSVFGSVTDVDHNAALKGWAITSAAADTQGNHWQYSTDQGLHWLNMDGASLNQALYLSITDLVRWTGVKGSNTELDAKAVDDTGAALHAANAAATLVDASLSGGSTAYSAATAVLAAGNHLLLDPPILGAPTVI